jgi:hypothetical protein
MKNAQTALDAPRARSSDVGPNDVKDAIERAGTTYILGSTTFQTRHRKAQSQTRSTASPSHTGRRLPPQAWSKTAEADP